MRSRFLLRALATLLLGPLCAMAQTLYWNPAASTTALGGTGTWSTASSSWNNSATPSAGVTPWANGNSAVFAGSGGTITNNSTLTAANVTFAANYTLNGSGSVTTTGAVAVTGGTLTLGSGTALGTSALSLNGGTLSSTGTTTVANAFSLAANSAVDAAAGNTLTLSGAITGGGAIAKNGNGTVIFSGSNSYSGRTTINSGTLRVSGGSGIGNSSEVTVAGGATLDVVTSETIGSLLSDSTGASVTIAANQVLSTDGNFDFDFRGSISGGGGLTKIGSADLYLTGTNSYTGPTTITSGALYLTISGGSNGTLSPATAVTLANAGTARLVVDVSNTIGSLAGGGSSGGNVLIASGKTLTTDGTGALTPYAGALSGAGGLVKAGPGTLVLSGNSNGHTGTTTVNGGTLQLSGGNALGNTSAVTLANTAGATLAIAASETIGTLAGGGPLGGNVTIASGQILTTDGAGAATPFAGVISGSGGLTKAGTGTLTLPGVNTFSGGTIVSGGTLVASNSSALGSGAVTLASGNATSLFLDSTVPGLSFSNPITVSAGTGAATIGSTSGSNYSIFAGPLSLNRPTTLNDGGISGQRTTFDGVISGDVGTLTITGNRVTLAGANTFTGNVAIGNGSTLQISSGNQVLPLSASVDTGTGGRLWIVGDTTIGALTGSAGSVVSVVPDTGSFSLNVGANNSDSTFGGSLQDSGYSLSSRLTLSKVGTGALTLTGNNSHSSTVLYAGTLILGADGVVGDNLYLRGGTLQASGNRSLPHFYLQTDATIGGPDNLTITGQVIGDPYATHYLVKSGSGTLTYAASFSGDPHVINVVDDGTLVLAGSGGSTISNSLFVNPGGTVRVDAANQIAYNANIYLQGGTLHLNNVSDGYTQGFQTGSLYLTGGTLSASGVNGAFHQGGTTTTYASPDTATISAPLVLDGTNTNLTFTVADGAAATDLAITGPVSSLSGAVNLVKQGAGLLRLSGDNTYTGSTTLTAGTLVADSATALSDSSVFLNGGTLHLTNGSALQNSGVTITNSTVTFGDTVTAATFKTLVSTTANAATSGIALTNTAAVPQGVQLTTGADGVVASYFGVLSGLGGLTKTGTGTVVLRGVNTYTGPTQVLQGFLNLTGNGRLPSTTDLYVGGGFFQTMVAATVGTLSGTGQVNLQTAASSLTADGLGTASPFTGYLVGPGSFIKQGPGTLVFAGPSSHTGLTTVSAGVLNLQYYSALGTTDAGTTVSSGGALELQGGIAIGAEALTLRGAGATASPHGALRNVSGANSYAGAITLGSAATIASDAGTLTLGTGGITGAAQALTFDGAGDTVFQGVIGTTSGTLTKNGAGLLTLSGANTFTGLTTVNAGTLRLSGGNAIANTGAISLANTAGATLDLNGTSEAIGSLAGGGTTGGNVTLGAGTLTTGGANTSTAFAGVLSGTGGLVKTGNGTFTLSGASTYSGVTAINAGALNLQHATALGTTAAGTSVAAGGALELQGGVAIGAETLALNGTGVAGNGALRNVSGANSYAGAITLSSASTITSTAGTLTLGAGGISGAAQALTVDGAGNTSITGAIATGGGSLTKTGTGTLFLTGSAANTFTGTTTISGGTVTLAKDNNVAAVSGPVSILAGGRLDYAGFNQLTAAGAGVTLDGGTLDIQGAGYRGFAPSLDFRAGTILTTGGGVGTQLNLSADSPGAFTVRGGLSVPLTLALLGTSSTSGLTYDATGNGGLTTMTGAVVLADAGTTFTIQDSTAPIDLSISGAIVEVFGARQLIKTGAGTLELTAANTLSNGADLKAGGLALGHNAALGSGALVIEGGSLQATGAARTIANPATLAADFTFTGAPALTLSGVATLTGTRAITTASGSTATFGGAIGDGGSAFGLTKLGTGTLVLSGTNTYSGTTTVSAGTLTLSGPQGGGSGVTVRGPLVIGSAGTVRVTTGSQITDTAPITINGGTLFIDNAIEGHTTGGLAFTGGQLTAAGTGIFHLVNGLATNAAATTALVSAPLNIFPSTTFTVAAGNAPGGIDLSITGAISQVGTSPLVKNGAGALQLTGTNTYSGGTAINGGTLRISADANLGAAGGAVSFAGSTLRTDSSFTTARAATFSSGGTFDTAGGTTLTWQGGIGGTGALTYVSGTAINQGTLQLSGSAALPASGTLTLANVAGTALGLSGSQTIGSLAGGGTTGGNVTLSSGTFTTGGTNASTAFSGTLSGSGALVKTGIGAFTLAGTNTGFSGGTTLAAGSLIARNSSAFGSGAVVLNDAATAFYLDSTVGGLQLPNAITVAAGTAPATIGSTAGGNFSVFTGPITLNRPTTLNDGGDAGQRTTFNGVISGNVGTLAITGNRVTFGAANTFTGNVGVGAGATLQLSTFGNQILPLTARVDVAAAGKLTFVTATAIGGLSGAAGSFVQVADGTPAATLTVGALNTNTVFAGTLQNGTGAAITSLAKTGTGTLTLSGANTYTGGTTLNNGALAVSTDANLGGAGGAVVFGGGTLQATRVSPPHARPRSAPAAAPSMS